MAVIVLGVFTGQAILALLQSWYQSSYTHYYTFIWRQQFINALVRVRWRYSLEVSRGELANVLSQETARLSSAAGKFLIFLNNLLVAIAYKAASFFMSATASLMMIGVGLTLVIFDLVILRRSIKYARTFVKGKNQMMIVAQEFLSNIKAVKATPPGFSIGALVSEPLETIFSSGRVGYMSSPFMQVEN